MSSRHNDDVIIMNTFIVITIVITIATVLCIFEVIIQRVEV